MRALTKTAAAIAILGAAVTPTFAADLYRPPAEPVAHIVQAQPYRWSGFYMGGSIGTGWAESSVTNAASAFNFSGNQSNFAGGGQIGFNSQTGGLVWGLEGALTWTSLGYNAPTFASPAGAMQASSEADWTGTLAARLGFAADNWLFYGKAGWAWAQTHDTVTNLATSVSVSSTHVNNGWLVGGGIEWGLSQHWTARLEYNFVGLDDRNMAGPNSVVVRDDTHIQTLMLGVNYKF